MLTGNRLKQKITPYAAKFLAAGNVYRLSILYMLIREPVTLPMIIRRLGISPSLAAHHLKTLRLAGLVTKSKFGKLVTYYADDVSVKEIVTLLRKP